MNSNLLETYRKHGIDESQVNYWRLITNWKKECSIKLFPDYINIKTILEIGCASGMLLKDFSKEIKPSISMGVDFSKESIKIAKVEFPIGNYFLGDGQQLPFKDGSIDLIIASDILEHFETPEIGLNEMQRVAKYVIFKIPLEKCIKTINSIYGPEHPSGHFHKWNKSDAIKMLKKSGYKIIQSSLEIPPNQIKFYKERYKNIPLRKLFIKMEKYVGKHFPFICTIIYGNNLFAFCTDEDNDKDNTTKEALL